MSGGERWERWKRRARRLAEDVHVVALAARDPRVPWYTRLLAVAVVGYALSPIDLIPDFIPVLGYLDDLVLIPLGLALVLRMIPPNVLEGCRAEARERAVRDRTTPWIAAVLVVAVWLLAAGALALWVARRMAAPE